MVCVSRMRRVTPRALVKALRGLGGCGCGGLPAAPSLLQVLALEREVMLCKLNSPEAGPRGCRAPGAGARQHSGVPGEIHDYPRHNLNHPMPVISAFSSTT